MVSFALDKVRVTWIWPIPLLNKLVDFSFVPNSTNGNIILNYRKNVVFWWAIMTKCTMSCISLTSWHFEVRSNKESWLCWDDNNKVKVVGLMPDINQLVWYEEMVCLFVPDNAGILKWHRMKWKKGDSSPLERSLRLKFYRFVCISRIFES